MKYASTACEVGGLAAASYGCYQLASWLGWLVAGLCLVLIGAAAGGRP